MPKNDRRHAKNGKSDEGCCSTGRLMTVFAVIMVLMMILILRIVAVILNPMARTRNPTSAETRLKNTTESFSIGLDSRTIHKASIDEKIDTAGNRQFSLSAREDSICDSLDENMPLLLSILRGEEVQVYDDTQARFRMQSLIETDTNGYQIPFAADMRIAATNGISTSADQSGKIIVIKGFNHDLIDRAFRKKHLYFIGDSTSRNLFVALRRLLNFIQFGVSEDHNETDNISSNSRSATDKYNGLNYDKWTASLEILFAKAQKKWKFGDSLPPYMIPADRTYIQILDVNNIYTENTNKREGFVNLTKTALVHPNAIIFNAGLHLLQLNPIRKMRPYHCESWVQYESILNTLLQVSIDSEAPIILAKSTNHICDAKFGPEYRQYAKLYTEKDEKTLEDCEKILEKQEKERKGEGITRLSKALRDEICKFGTFNGEGSSLLNQRMAQFVEEKRTSIPGRLRFFNDHDIESCNFTRGGDGRHYQEQVFVRLHLLAIMLDCMSD